MKLHLLFFARLRERLGTAEETLELDGAPSVSDLIAHLQARGGAWAEELGEGKGFRVAVNQALVQGSTAIPDGAEVAIFPLVTGG
jgi:molybdopterin converting factor subunit 1